MPHVQLLEHGDPVYSLFPAPHLDGCKHGMPHVQFARDVGRWHGDCIRWPLGVLLWTEVAPRLPPMHASIRATVCQARFADIILTILAALPTQQPDQIGTMRSLVIR
eukprot:scaffold197576_cov18-Tisochrysis_lutea.AAC.3